MFFGLGCVMVVFAFWIGILVGMKVRDATANGKTPPV